MFVAWKKSGESERPAGSTFIEYDSNSNRHIRTQHHVGWCKLMYQRLSSTCYPEMLDPRWQRWWPLSSSTPSLWWWTTTFPRQNITIQVRWPEEHHMRWTSLPRRLFANRAFANQWLPRIWLQREPPHHPPSYEKISFRIRTNNRNNSPWTIECWHE